MSHTRRIHWGLVLLAGLLAEVAIIAIYFVLLTAAMVAGVPEIARPTSTLDYIDAMVSSFVMMFLLTLWVGRRIDSGYVLHGALIGLVGFLLFTTLIFALSGSLSQPPLYLVAHGLKVAGGITGGLVAKKRSMTRRTLLPT
jgi:hypothetical protein